MSDLNLFQALQEVKDARVCIAHDEERLEHNARIVRSALGQGDDRRILGELSDYSSTMQRIHEELLQGKRLGRYRGLEHYLGREKISAFRETASQLELWPDEAVTEPGNTTRLLGNIYVDSSDITAKIAKFAAPALTLGLYVFFNFIGPWDSLEQDLTVLSMCSLAYVGSFLFADALVTFRIANPHQDFALRLDRKKEEFETLLVSYKRQSSER